MDRYILAFLQKKKGPQQATHAFSLSRMQHLSLNYHNETRHAQADVQQAAGRLRGATRCTEREVPKQQCSAEEHDRPGTMETVHEARIERS